MIHIYNNEDLLEIKVIIFELTCSLSYISFNRCTSLLASFFSFNNILLKIKYNKVSGINSSLDFIFLNTLSHEKKSDITYSFI